MNPPTISDVAKMAGVSTTTVSHILNGTRYVSEELKERVEKAISTLGYRPNSLARGLRRGESKTIGLIVPDNSNPFFAEILRLIENIGYSRGYSVILCNSDSDTAKEAAYTELLHEKQVDGIIFIATNNSAEHLEQLSRKGIPIVVVDRDISLENTDVILADNFQGGYEATRYLISLGHRRIACVGGSYRLLSGEERVNGYLKALAEARIPVDPAYLVHGDFRYKSGEQAMIELLSRPVKPTAVFACNDLMALGAMTALRNAHFALPNQMSLVGFDDISLTSMVSPSLTTVAQPVEDMAQLAIDLLINRIQNKTEEYPAKRVVLPTELVIRESCSIIGD